MEPEEIRLLVAALVGGILGWSLGKLPDKYVYVIIFIVAALALVVFAQA